MRAAPLGPRWHPSRAPTAQPRRAHGADVAFCVFAFGAACSVRRRCGWIAIQYSTAQSAAAAARAMRRRRHGLQLTRTRADGVTVIRRRALRMYTMARATEATHLLLDGCLHTRELLCGRDRHVVDCSGSACRRARRHGEQGRGQREGGIGWGEGGIGWREGGIGWGGGRNWMGGGGTRGRGGGDFDLTVQTASTARTTSGWPVWSADAERSAAQRRLTAHSLSTTACGAHRHRQTRTSQGRPVRANGHERAGAPRFGPT